MSDETLFKTMLFDFFGDLLTEKQYEYYDLYHNEDYSLSEIAAKAGISRQGVYDIISRAEKSLAQMERKTGVVRKWLDTRVELEQASRIARELLRSLNDKKNPTDLAKQLIVSLDEIGKS